MSIDKQDKGEMESMDSILQEICGRINQLASDQREDNKQLRESVDDLKKVLADYMVSHAACKARCEASIVKVDAMERSVGKNIDSLNERIGRLDSFQYKLIGAILVIGIFVTPIINRFVSKL